MTANMIATYRAELHCNTADCAAAFTLTDQAVDRLAYVEKIRQAAAAAGWTLGEPPYWSAESTKASRPDTHDLCPACTAGHGPVTPPRFTPLPPGDMFVVVELADKRTTDLPHVVNGAEVITDPTDAAGLADDYNQRAATDARPGENVPQYVPMQLVEVQPR